jgi:hypothetical protein
MAADKGGDYGEPTKVEVDPAKLTEEAGELETWGVATLTNYQGLVSMVFPVGNFPAANRLRDRLNDCVKQLATNAWNIGNELKTVIPENLRESASQYNQDEDDNKRDGERAFKFATDTSKYGPGAGSTVTVQPGTTPPQETKPVSTPPDFQNK